MILDGTLSEAVSALNNTQYAEGLPSYEAPAELKTTISSPKLPPHLVIYPPPSNLGYAEQSSQSLPLIGVDSVAGTLPERRPSPVHSTSDPLLVAQPSSSTLLTALPQTPLTPTDAIRQRPKSRMLAGFSPSSKSVSQKGITAVRTTVFGLITELVQNINTEDAAGVLAACDRACQGVNLSLSDLLQERTIENHTPLYWAILKLTPENAGDGREGPHTLIIELLKSAGVLNPDTVSDALLACARSSDNSAFQLCRPYIFVIDPADCLILGNAKACVPYSVTVKSLQDTFTASIEIPLFHRRIRALGRVGAEFAFAGRLFEFTIEITGHEHSIEQERQRQRVNNKKKRDGAILRPLRKRKGVKKGQWVVAVALLEHSAPTPLDAHIVVSSTQEAPLSLPIQTPRDHSLSPSPRGGECGEVFAKLNDKDGVITSFKSEMGPYVAGDGALHLSVEGKLAKPQVEESGCIIC